MVYDTKEASLDDPSVRFGRYLANPPPGEEVVISGMAGTFPLCSNIEEYQHNLYNKICMITHIQQENPEWPNGLGKLKPEDINKFDPGFFGCTLRESVPMSPMEKLLLEKTIECIFDAGLHPDDLQGTKTGIFCGICFTENESHWYYENQIEKANTILGNSRSVMVNKISHFLKLKGPSTNADTACSSSMFALENAYVAIRSGEIDRAVVCGANLLLSYGTTLQFARLGVLSKDGVLRAFDESGKGYVRSEAISSILLEKAKDSKRIYARIVHTKTNCDGYKPQSITYPSGEAQYNLLKETYFESGVNPKDISYIEAHGTGTQAGDPEEVNGIDEFFTKGRTKPLLVGSVKSSIGHSESSSGLCSIVKAILAFETNIIPPNINFNTPRKNIPGLWEGRLKVPVDNTPLQDQNGLIGVSSFGFGGANAHAILKWNKKTKQNKGKPLDNLPRLVCVSGRTEEAVVCLLNDVAEKFDVEHIALIHNSFRKPVRNHLFRGYVIVSKQGVLKQTVSPYNINNSKLHISFGSLPRSSGNLVYDLLALPLLANFKNSLLLFLTKKHLELNSVLSNPGSTNLNLLLSGIITQLTLAEILKQLEVEYKTVSGCSFGEFTAAYFESSLSLEEVLECVHAVAVLIKDVEMTKNGGGINPEALYKYKSKIESEFKRFLNGFKQFNGFNGTESKSTSGEYFAEAIMQKNQQGVKNVPKEYTVLEIDQIQTFYEHKRNTVVRIDTDGGFKDFLENLGSLYEYGIQSQIQKLYPQVQFPVSRGTPMINSKIKWKHDHDFFVLHIGYLNSVNGGMNFSISLDDEKWADLGGHVIDGRNLFPATGYLYLVWHVFSEIENIDQNQLKVVFENCKFKRACNLPKKGSGTLDLTVVIQQSSGKFEVTEGDIPVVTGRIRFEENVPTYTYNTLADEGLTEDVELRSRDIYKELRLRGYNYMGLFKSLVQFNQKASVGKLRWSDNWIAFMDNMLQMKILAEDTRLLYVPTRISRLSIDPIAHVEYLEKLRGDDPDKILDLPVEYNKDTSVIRCGAVEICGLLASSIPRKKITALPVLEKYQFIPNVSKLPLEQAVRVFIQIALENNCGFKVKVAETFNESGNNAVPLAPIIQDVLGDQPLVTGDITIFTSHELDVPVKVEKSNLTGEEYTIVVGKGWLSDRKEELDTALKAAVDSGFIISREPLTSNNPTPPSCLALLNISEVDGEKIVFMRKLPQNIRKKPSVYINVSTQGRIFSWLDKLKDAASKDYNVIAWCQNEPLNGIVGLVNCIRREPGCQDVRSFFIVDEAPEFDPTNPFYKQQLDKNLGVNVFMNGQWGTYRHLLLENLLEVESEHCYANNTIRGDLSSIKWIEGTLTSKSQTTLSETLLDVYYASMNFRDVMTASGRLNVDVISHDRRNQDCIQGFEYSGKTKSGKRIMGMVSQGAMATIIKTDKYLSWNVPDSWTLQEAATVPVVYSTCIFALFVVGRIKPTDSILIHSGTGGVGQAAITLCLGIGCTVFTTVGTEEKKQFILKKFPQIKASHIGNSRDLSFEQMIHKETFGRGVDVVLNSLAEEKLFATARCLAANGRFLEIGKFDLANDNQLDLLPFKDGVSYHGVMLDKLFMESDFSKEKLQRIIQSFIDSGAVKPLNSNVFKMDELEQAYRFMSTGKHMGKVLVEVRKEDVVQIDNRKYKCLPKYYCDPDKSYIICGGLGGFGLELADWLVLRGARNLILTSRQGVSNGYQSYRISIWKSYGVSVIISTKDITTKSGCEELIDEANSLAPVHGIFNLAVVLQDSILENQTEKAFETSFGPKAYATQNLDEITRKQCPELRDFVIFSSVSCGRGNAGQSNYGMSNSVMERICEKRRREGYPALAIEWGAIGDVGLVAALQEDHKELEIGGTLQQSIANCLQVMDLLLRQQEASIVSSIVVAEKLEASITGSIEDVICAILGIRDIKTVSLSSTLAELGMDSMTAVEVKQTLEREYNIFLSPSEIRSITLQRVKDMADESCEVVPVDENVADKPGYNAVEIIKNYIQSAEIEPIITLKSKISEDRSRKPLKVIAFPGVEGVCDILNNLTEKLEVEAYGINYIASKKYHNYPQMADELLPDVKNLLKKDKSFNLIAHSFGSTLALEIVSRLEDLGYVGTLTLLDGSPSFLMKFCEVLQLDTGEDQFSNLENGVLGMLLRSKLDENETIQVLGDICKCSTLDEKVNLMVAQFGFEKQEENNLKLSIRGVIDRSKACLLYKPTFTKLKSKIKLYRPKIKMVDLPAEDYGLEELTEQPISVKFFEGNHTSFLECDDLAKEIMQDLSVVNGFAEA